MNYKLIEEKLKSDEYEFLRTNEKLKDNIILMTLRGSYAYGTNVNTPEHTSDIDIGGIFLNSKEEILTMNCSKDVFRDTNTDSEFYPLKYVIELFSECNPSTIQILGTSPEQIFICTNEGKMLRENSDIFLSKIAYNSFSGYVSKQYKRILNALSKDLPVDEKEGALLESIKTSMITFEERYQNIPEDLIHLFIDKSSKQNYENEIFITMSPKTYPLRDLKGMLTEISRITKDFDKIKHRNSLDKLHFNKHAMNMFRAYFMGTEILEGKGINTYREKDKEFLLDIINGKYTFEQICDMKEKYSKDFEYAFKYTSLPDKPDYKKIKEITMEINKSIILKS